MAQYNLRMPELPEIEVLKRSLEPQLVGRRFGTVRVRDPRLREPVDARRLRRHCRDREILGLRRRSKYLLVDLEGGYTLVVHLGMSGRLTLAPAETPAEAHEHLSFGVIERDRRYRRRKLRFRDPRRFGLVLSLQTRSLDGDRHFAHLGVEPLGERFSGRLLARAAEGRRVAVKSFLMDARQVVGVGNIYACEALFRSGIHPFRAAGRISRKRWDRLGDAIVDVLGDAIRQGGTTLNDFADGDGNVGYFQVALDVYGREAEPCTLCSRPIRREILANRSTFYCPGCQR